MANKEVVIGRAAWSMMKQRCFNPSNSDYHYYGGRGIMVCERWRNSFAAFIEDMGPRPPGMTLERKDNNGNYEKDNCKWATAIEQRHNHRPHKPPRPKKLSPEEVAEIRKLYRWGNGEELAKQFGVRGSTILRIASGQTRKKVDA